MSKARKSPNEIFISSAGRRIIKLLVGKPPQTVAQLAKAGGVTRTAVIEQLEELMSAGFVSRQLQPPTGRGRPRHLYRATNTALKILSTGNQQLVVPVIWRAVLEVGGEELLKKVLKQVSQALAEYYAAKITAKRPEERLRQFIALTAAEGGLTDVEENSRGQLVVHRRSCPFITMVDSRRSVCQVDQDLLGTVVGRPVRRVSCRYKGDPCCSFEVC